MIDAPIILELLDNSPLFRGIPQKILSPIFKQAVLISLDQGERLLSPGIRNENVYIIISGQMSVNLTLSNLDEPLTILTPGECVGEMSVLLDSTVSAYVIANTDCKLLAIGYSSFWSLIKGSNESARNMLNILVQRIRMGNEVIADTLSQHDKFPDKKSDIDNKTGLYSHNGILDKFDRLLHLCTVGSRPFSLIMLHVDETKSAPVSVKESSNDQGLRTIAQSILLHLRRDDCAARLSGNNFVMLLPDLPISDACATAERVREAVSQTPVLLPDGSSQPPVIISAGICRVNEDDTWSMLMARASQALEQANNAGSNRLSNAGS